MKILILLKLFIINNHIINIINIIYIYIYIYIIDMKITKKDLLNELLSKQKKNISEKYLLSFKDLNRIVKNIDTSLLEMNVVYGMDTL